MSYLFCRHFHRQYCRFHCRFLYITIHIYTMFLIRNMRGNDNKIEIKTEQNKRKPLDLQ